MVRAVSSGRPTRPIPIAADHSDFWVSVIHQASVALRSIAFTVTPIAATDGTTETVKTSTTPLAIAYARKSGIGAMDWRGQVDGPPSRMAPACPRHDGHLPRR